MIMLNELTLVSSCGRTRSLCDYAFAKTAVGLSAFCMGGNGTCASANMKTVEGTNAFHPDELKRATETIQNVLKGLKKPSEGMELAFLNMGDGVMLAWVEHTIMTGTDDPAEVRSALGIRDVTEAAPSYVGVAVEEVDGA